MIKDKVTVRVVLSDGFVVRINGEVANKEALERRLGTMSEPVDQLIFRDKEYDRCGKSLPDE